MAIHFQCPGCGRMLRVSDEKAGQSGKCPGCGQVVRIPAEQRPLQPPTLPPAVFTGPQRAPEVFDPSRAEVGDARLFQPLGTRLSEPLPRPLVAVQVQQPPRVSNSLGIASMVLGILALLICWIPLLNILGLPLGLLGIILGGIGLIVAVLRKGSGIGFPIAGTAISLLATAVILVITMAIGQALSETAARSPSLPAARGGMPQRGPGVGQQAGFRGRQQRNEPFDNWLDASKPVRVGDAQIWITGVRVGKVPLTDITGYAAESVENHLMITIRITNLNPVRKLDYRTWRGLDFAFEQDYATLEDNFGNRYKRVQFGLGSVPRGAVDGGESVYPNRSVVDMLVFEPPVPNVQSLNLTLPCANLGMEGIVRLRIPRAMIKP